MTLTQIGFARVQKDPFMPANRASPMDDLLSLLHSLSLGNTVMRLTRSFRGLLISQDVYLVSVGSGGATFQASDSRLCATPEGLVNLHSRLFPRPLVARMTEADVRQGTFVLSDIAYIGSQWIERRSERVTPKGPAHVTMLWRRKAIRASLEDLSVKGMGLLAYKLLERGTHLQPGSHVLLDFELPNDYGWTAMRGIVVYVNQCSSSLVRIGLRLQPNDRDARSLESYVAQRKLEIVDELEQAYFKARGPVGVERLYF
jgi:hypothetical protein